MAKRQKTEEIMTKLRQFDVLVSSRVKRGGRGSQHRSDGGHVLSLATGVRRLKSDQIKHIKDLEIENSRLRKAIFDLTLDKLILQEASRGNF